MRRIYREEGLSPDSWSNAPGDRLDLPAGVTYEATVGPEGVTCLEARRLE
ncbi:MAG TPA: hypothetical protein VGP82_20325 [Ktedonobacterales bacterium]|nr:hypothetical protein [Ktedonobacterales bacterium]